MRTDAHVHVWTDALTDSGRRVGARAVEPTDTLDRLRPFAVAQGVDRVVLVQTVGGEHETERLLDLADSDPLVAGVVGWVDLSAADAGERIDRLIASTGGELLVGIRSMVPHVEEGFAGSAMADGMRALAERGLALELLLSPSRLADALAVVRAMPGIRTVIDHLAKPDVDGGDLEVWRAALIPLAGNETVAVKLSGLLTQLDPLSQSVDDLAPYVATALDAFGPDRVMIGSDWPLCEPVGGYQHAFGSMERLVADWAGEPWTRDGSRHDPRPAAALDRIRNGTAAEWYGLRAGPRREPGPRREQPDPGRAT
jgi:predicted TIM-barrel fold metal-dependent hydrolase